MALKPGTAIVKAMDEKRVVHMRGDKEKFGVPYIVQAVGETAAKLDYVAEGLKL